MMKNLKLHSEGALFAINNKSDLVKYIMFS